MKKNKPVRKVKRVIYWQCLDGHEHISEALAARCIGRSELRQARLDRRDEAIQKLRHRASKWDAPIVDDKELKFTQQLSKRTRNVLIKEGIHTVGELRRYSGSNMWHIAKMPGVGEKTYRELDEFLKAYPQQDASNA